MNTRTIAITVVFAACGSEPEPHGEVGRPDIPPIPGHRYVMVEAESTWSTCDREDFVFFDRMERVDIHPSNMRVVFSTPDQPYAFWKSNLEEDPERADGWVLIGEHPKRLRHERPDGTADEGPDLTMDMRLTLVERESLIIEADFDLTCIHESLCEPYVSDGAEACGMGRRWTLEYSHDIDDYYPLYPSWVDDE